MSFNPSKCTIITISRSNSPLHKFYTLLWCSPAARQWSQVPGCFTEWRPAVVEARPAYHSQGQQHAGSSTARSSPLPRKTERTCLHLTCSVSLGILCRCVGSIQNHWPTCTGVSPKASCKVHKERLLLPVQCVSDAPGPTVAASQGKKTRDQADTSLPNSSG